MADLVAVGDDDGETPRLLELPTIYLQLVAFPETGAAGLEVMATPHRCIRNSPVLPLPRYLPSHPSCLGSMPTPRQPHVHAGLGGHATNLGATR